MSGECASAGLRFRVGSRRDAHGAGIAGECGFPAAISVEDAIKVIKEGQIIGVNGYLRKGLCMVKRKWTHEEIKEYRKTHGRFFYCNKEDSNFLVPKAFGFGRTVNWANPLSWLFAFVIICIIIWKAIFKQ